MAFWQRHGAVGFGFQAGLNVQVGADLLLYLLI